ncbi:hypothetical protein AVEN_12634-1 [Araneus ventricosus]|uniref:Integrase zinc-binding domain-containing protein n=1 Tax=Araneus ventricosus TaxID=182803 RepID=A0A4Y2ACG4_ARAVE|nr:hypothetical protein AVEN_12634-1 [Araneus ventricosus]
MVEKLKQHLTVFPYSIHDSENEYVRRLVTQAEESRQLTRIRTLEAQQRDKNRYDSKHRDVSYNPGDLVWVFTPVRKVVLAASLIGRYFGPYRVVQRLSSSRRKRLSMSSV